MLKYSVFTKNLYSESGQLLKTLDCPYHKRWKAFLPISASSRQRETCPKFVANTQSMSTQEIERLLAQVEFVLDEDSNQFVAVVNPETSRMLDRSNHAAVQKCVENVTVALLF